MARKRYNRYRWQVTSWSEEQEEALPVEYTDVPPLSTEPETPRKSRISWFGRGDSQQQRLDDLNISIQLYPDSATNYVLRGELFEKQKHYELAIADFETAQALASDQVMTDRWGLVNQAVQDRAIRGLRRVKNRE